MTSPYREPGKPVADVGSEIPRILWESPSDVVTKYRVVLTWNQASMSHGYPPSTMRVVETLSGRDAMGAPRWTTVTDSAAALDALAMVF